jgi:hypothetical protein
MQSHLIAALMILSHLLDAAKETENITVIQINLGQLIALITAGGSAFVGSAIAFGKILISYAKAKDAQIEATQEIRLNEAKSFQETRVTEAKGYAERIEKVMTGFESWQMRHEVQVEKNLTTNYQLLRESVTAISSVNSTLSSLAERVGRLEQTACAVQKDEESDRSDGEDSPRRRR